MSRKKLKDVKYHIYFKNKCIYDSLSRNEFEETWKMIHNFVSIFGTVDKEDLSYKEVLN